MIRLLIQVVLIVVIAGLALWVIQQFPVDPTIYRVGRVVIIVVAVILLVYLLLGAIGGGMSFGTHPLIR